MTVIVMENAGKWEPASGVEIMPVLGKLPLNGMATRFGEIALDQCDPESLTGNEMCVSENWSDH
jgi:hypothetical protein